MAMRTRIKICGITRHEDLACAVNAGADAVGFVFHPTSKRCVTAHQASLLVRDLPAFVSSVALFVNPNVQAVQQVIDEMQPSLLQFHGDESPEFCASFAIPYIKAFRVGAPEMDTAQALAQSCRRYLSARGWLFDSFTPAYGGSGHSFDHGLLSELLTLDPSSRRPLILSGGLTPQNLEVAIQRLRPWAVDVSSGVEQGPGIKSPELISAFVAAVKSSDR
jgi:phosphoribosylanthranilate isomerase